MSDTTGTRPDPDVHAEVQRACEEHLAECYAALYAEDYAAEQGEQIEDYPADLLAPFCGCETCVVREVLHAARPYFARLAAAEAGDTR